MEGNEWNTELFQLVLFAPRLLTAGGAPAPDDDRHRACAGANVAANVRIQEDTTTKAAMEEADAVIDLTMRAGVSGAADAASLQQGSLAGERFEQALKESFAIALGVSPANVWLISVQDSPATAADTALDGPCGRQQQAAVTDTPAPSPSPSPSPPASPCAMVLVHVDVSNEIDPAAGHTTKSAERLGSDLMSQLRNASSPLQLQLHQRGVRMDSLFTPLLSIHFNAPPHASGTAALAVEIAVPLLLLLLGSSVLDTTKRSWMSWSSLESCST